MRFDDLEPRPKPQIIVGADLSAVAIDDLKVIVGALEDEISRVKSEIARKEKHKAAADSVFGRKD